MNWLMSRAVSKKGMASPAEYTARRRTPRAIVSLAAASARTAVRMGPMQGVHPKANAKPSRKPLQIPGCAMLLRRRSEEHTSELQSRLHLVCRLLLEKKKQNTKTTIPKPQHQLL